MTYPPQQGQPYGQAGYPPPGQVPQGQYQQPYGYPQGGFGGPPPRKSRTGLVVGLAVAGVAVVAFVLTAFVAPGFLLSDDDGGTGSGGGGDGGDNGGGGTAAAVAQQVVDGFNTKDSAALTALQCGDADSDTVAVIKLIDDLDNAELGEVQETSDTEATAEATITYKGTSVPATVNLANEGDAWCWQGFTTGSSGSSGPADGSGDSGSGSSGPGDGSDADADAEQLSTDFLDAVNTGDTEKAMSYVCADAKARIGDRVEEAAGASAELSLAEVNGAAGSYNAHVTGTVAGQPIEGNLLLNEQADGLCVKLVLIS